MLIAVFGGLALLATLPPDARGASTTGNAAATLQVGSSGAQVRSLQLRLARLGYLDPAAVDGLFGIRTWHAVIAFQGWSRLDRDGIVGPNTGSALARAGRPSPWSPAPGIEIHVQQQVMLLVADGRAQRAIHVSTGAGGATPLGHFQIYRRETMSWSVPFRVWMPLAQYFVGGYAIHEFGSVPAYPASHGCVRVPDTDSRAVWQFAGNGVRVWTTA